MCKIIPCSLYREFLWPSTILYMSKRLVEAIQCKFEVAQSILIDSAQTLHPRRSRIPIMSLHNAVFGDDAWLFFTYHNNQFGRHSQCCSEYHANCYMYKIIYFKHKLCINVYQRSSGVPHKVLKFLKNNLFPRLSLIQWVILSGYCIFVPKDWYCNYKNCLVLIPELYTTCLYWTSFQYNTI